MAELDIDAGFHPDMKNDGQRNLLGHIDENELMILDEIGAGDIYGFVEV